MASSWPKTTNFKSLSKFANCLISFVETLFGGIRAILAITTSKSLTPNNFFLLYSGNNICEAPSSSITSIALSGNFLSLIYLILNSTAAFIAAFVYLTLWCFS